MWQKWGCPGEPWSVPARSRREGAQPAGLAGGLCPASAAFCWQPDPRRGARRLQWLLLSITVDNEQKRFWDVLCCPLGPCHLLCGHPDFPVKCQIFARDSCAVNWAHVPKTRDGLDVGPAHEWPAATEGHSFPATTGHWDSPWALPPPPQARVTLSAKCPPSLTAGEHGEAVPAAKPGRVAEARIAPVPCPGLRESSGAARSAFPAQRPPDRNLLKGHLVQAAPHQVTGEVPCSVPAVHQSPGAWDEMTPCQSRQSLLVAGGRCPGVCLALPGGLLGTESYVYYPDVSGGY